MITQAFRTVSFVFIDAGVADPQQLLQGLQPGVQAHILDAQQDGIQQITNILKKNRALSEVVREASPQELGHGLRLHIVAHAIPGSIRLGNTHLSLDTDFVNLFIKDQPIGS